MLPNFGSGLALVQLVVLVAKLVVTSQVGMPAADNHGLCCSPITCCMLHVSQGYEMCLFSWPSRSCVVLTVMAVDSIYQSLAVMSVHPDS